jgi:hypothetical protein
MPARLAKIPQSGAEVLSVPTTLNVLYYTVS